MFKKDVKAPDKFDTLVGKNTIFQGNIETSGTIRIDGKVQGEIKADGDVYLGKSSEVTGNIYANNVFLSGKVEGNIEARGLLDASSTAVLYGDILVQNLITSEGSIFEGRCKMLEKQNSDSKVKNTRKKSEKKSDSTAYSDKN
ncbi:bactofilin family protein [Acetivibrio saccincola]|uniref:Cell shape determination protein CcmA n=1 Tax=Acetivibrio saccincola TaxID=1677857 RepID=A0A2S8RA69_9FIRM|nr:polymer-forming cytoskeletal protein [Acetivibrio saccincola]PQQ66685.1 cell shape determination protein CcmA [Acetivibrio saccincola]